MENIGVRHGVMEMRWAHGNIVILEKAKRAVARGQFEVEYIVTLHYNLSKSINNQATVSIQNTKIHKKIVINYK